MTLVFRVVLLLFVCSAGLRPAHGTEHVGDALVVHTLDNQTAAVDALDREILALLETVPDDRRFELYWTYDQLMGTWSQVEVLQALLELAIAATSPLEEEEISTQLRDHARFLLWDLDEAGAQLELHTPADDQQQHRRINETIRALLSATRIIISRLLAAHCVHVQCAIDP